MFCFIKGAFYAAKVGIINEKEEEEKEGISFVRSAKKH